MHRSIEKRAVSAAEKGGKGHVRFPWLGATGTRKMPFGRARGRAQDVSRTSFVGGKVGLMSALREKD